MTRALRGPAGIAAPRLQKYAVVASLVVSSIVVGSAGAAMAAPGSAQVPRNAVQTSHREGVVIHRTDSTGRAKAARHATTVTAAEQAHKAAEARMAARAKAAKAAKAAKLKAAAKKKPSTKLKVAAAVGAVTAAGAATAVVVAATATQPQPQPTAPSAGAISVTLPVPAPTASPQPSVPTAALTTAPTTAPTASPTSVPTAAPTTIPTAAPTAAPVPVLTATPVVVSPAAVPAGAITWSGGSSLQTAVSNAPAGSVFVIPPGLHRGVSLAPKANDTFIGLPGAVLDGSNVMTGFTASSGNYVTGGVTAHSQVQGECDSASPGCAYPEDVFMDGTLLRRVTSVSALTAGAYYIDYTAQQLWLGSNPAGHLVEMATLPVAFGGSAPGVTIEDLTVQKYASPGQRGAIDATDASGWSVIGVSAIQNHGSGIILGDHGVARDCVTNANGEQGIGGSGADLVVDHCEIGGNNTDGYSAGWQAGGSKFSLTDNLLVENSYVHDNKGPGLWADVDNTNSTFSGNLVANNDGEGIFEEISNGARITGNTITGNGFGGEAWAFGAGVEVASSGSVEVDHNVLTNNFNSISGTQQNRGNGPQGVRLLQNLWVHDNVVTSGGPVWVAQDTGDMAVFSSRNNRFDDNTYPAAQKFSWLNHDGISEAQWNSYGEDVDHPLG